MPSESEVREAVEWGKNYSFNPEERRRLKPLSDLAEAWLGREVQTYEPHEGAKSGCLCCICVRARTIDACRLASVVSEEEIGKIIWGSDLLQHKGGASFVDVDKLSHAIAEYCRGGGK